MDWLLRVTTRNVPSGVLRSPCFTLSPVGSPKPAR